jgi:hypothetical protein
VTITQTGANSFQVVGTHTFPGPTAGSTLVASVTITDTVDKLHSTVTTPVAVSPVPVDPDEAFVRELYRRVLERLADGPGLASWLAALHSGVSRETVATSFWLSHEHHVVEVEQMYADIFGPGRTADPSGLGFWAGVLDNGMSEGAVTILFYTSAEFLASHPDFISGVFQSVYGRPSTAFEQTFWQDILRGQTRTPGEFVYYQLSSSEAAALATNQDFVFFLGRPADATATQFFVAAGRGGGPATPLSLALVFILTPEFQARAVRDFQLGLI